jgi:hypothetical protein
MGELGYSTRVYSIECASHSYSVPRLSPPVEPGRAFTHHASVPRLGGGTINIVINKMSSVKH